MTNHAKERAVERVRPDDIPLFVKGMKIAVERGMCCGPYWAIRIQAGRRVLGYGVGKRSEWTTTLASWMTLRDYQSQLLAVVKF